MVGEYDGKSELERALVTGAYGSPELKKEEKLRYLGNLRERVVEAVRFDQLGDRQALAALREALKDSRAVELVVHEQARMSVMSLIRMARENRIDFTITSNPQYQGDIAVVVVARGAVDRERVYADEAY